MSFKRPPASYPITGLCIVSDATRCPPGYDLIMNSQDRKEDCDLWKDSFFRSKITRYLCFSRVFPLEGGKLNNVLSDLVLVGEKDSPPDGFTLIDLTVDSREKATRKKQICVKMIERHSTTEAITELIILSRNKRAPIGFTLVGEMNGLTICFKMGSVPLGSEHSSQSVGPPPPIPTRPLSPKKPAPNHVINNHLPNNATQSSATRMNHQESIIPIESALTGVPFQLNSRFKDFDDISKGSMPEIQFRSLVDIMNEYAYTFGNEKSALETGKT